MPIGAVVAGVGALGAGVAGAVGTSNAAADQQKTSEAALAQNQKQAWRTQQNFAPYLTVGAGALAKLSQLYGITAPTGDAANPSKAGFVNNKSGSGSGDFSGKGSYASFWQSPDYNFVRTQGLKGITAAGAAGSGTNNGALIKAEEGYAGNLASTQYGAYKDSLMGLAGMGQNSAANSGYLSQQSSNANTGILTNQGNNAANADLAYGQIASSFVNNGASIYGRYAPSPNDNLTPVQQSAPIPYQTYVPGLNTGTGF